MAKVIIDSLLLKLTELALQGELKALKMVIDLISDKQTTSTGAKNNYIQVNNTRIDKLVIERLSKSSLIQIEEIIKTDLKN